MAGLKGIALSCPFDKRRNGPLLGEAAARHDRLPEVRRRGMALGAIVGAMVEKIRRRRTGIETEAIEWIRWHVAQGVVLHDQIA